MLFYQKIFTEDSHANDFFVIAGDNATQVLSFLEEDRYICETGGKFILTFPSPASGDLSSLEELFYTIWRIGKIDTIIVLTDWRCRVYSYVLVKGEDDYIRGAIPTLVHSWARNSSSSSNETNITYFLHNISSLRQSRLDVMVAHHYPFYDPLIEFLQVAMRASFNIIHTLERLETKLDIPSSLPVIKVSVFWANPEGRRNNILPSFFETDEAVFAVPRQLTSSVFWFRLINELSDYAWCGLLVSLISSVCFFYLYLKRTKDFVYVVLFFVQPLFQTSWSARYLPWRGRVFFTLWLLFCFVLTSSYLCTLHSELTVPNTDDAIKTFDDLVKSNLPVYARLNSAIRQLFEASPYFNRIEHTGSLVELDIRKVPPHKFVQKDRRDIAYILHRLRANEMLEYMPYRLLPNVIHTFISFPVRMTKPSPYQDIFEIAVMRSLAAGALDKVSEEYRQRNFRRSVYLFLIGEKGTKPLSLDSFDAMFVVWFSGCGIAFLVFVVECWFKQIRRCIIKRLGTLQ